MTTGVTSSGFNLGKYFSVSDVFIGAAVSASLCALRYFGSDQKNSLLGLLDTPLAKRGIKWFKWLGVMKKQTAEMEQKVREAKTTDLFVKNALTIGCSFGYTHYLRNYKIQTLILPFLLGSVLYGILKYFNQNPVTPNPKQMHVTALKPKHLKPKKIEKNKKGKNLEINFVDFAKFFNRNFSVFIWGLASIFVFSILNFAKRK